MVYTTPDYFPALVRQFHRETGWDEKNTYSSFCRISQAILDFAIPYGVSVSTGRSISSSLNSQLTFSMVPSKASSIGYLASSRSLFVDTTTLLTGPSADASSADFTDIASSSKSNITGKRIINVKQESKENADMTLLTGFSPSPKAGANASENIGTYSSRPTTFAFARQQQIEDERNFLQNIRAGVWKFRWDIDKPNSSDMNIDTSDPVGDYLMVAQMYPSLASITGSYTTRRSRTSEIALSGVSVAGVNPELQLVVQHAINKRKWSTETMFGSSGRLIGLRGQYNFGDVQALDEAAYSYYGGSDGKAKRVLGKKVNGRLSIGGEVYYGIQESSGGISLGARYRYDLPLLSELTCVVNPIMGHTSLAWTQQLQPRMCAAARYNFNAFSLSSELAMGLEWQLDDSSIFKVRWSDTQGLRLLLDARLSNMVFSMGMTLGGAGLGYLSADSTGTGSNATTALGIAKAPLSSVGIRGLVHSFGLQFQWFL
ncbi:Mitochondrial distribution and morphology protein 10 [Coemansia spiralis]|uniref:Mitochondrial distribution and morphology protein 10 n=2 Tax=Coemansia TaxID=4863 RepID=A0A9W8G1M7_9FUNG|nr:hypothetical protein BX070DRAFT_252176 [Coemansia spiralis]KAJ1991976.1 Mitochondrial distribution and morphology protein 10 [Coemansia umbellata]KAJ2625346.1 Mitochondrial distribution and morphology protein 10 [Coemansia sp. RSA 1358]KAJ2676184.1 Mitochondrial distribution and morphology protein 10 [Coemansia spiralis]